MRLVHASDLHVGFRAYNRDAKNGLNQREVDVSATLSLFIDRVIDLAPDVILLAGDIFHSPRPANSALLHAFAEFSRLAKALPNTPTIIASGNHDLAKESVSGVADINSIFERLGFFVANRTSKRFTFDHIGLSVLAVPDAPGVARPALVPDSGSKFNAVVLHGEVQGVRQGGAHLHASANEVSPDELGLAAWDYVGLGHYHQYERLAPNCVYSGAPDFTSSNPWQEITTPKGFVEHDLESGAHTFHVLAPNRTFVDLPPIEAGELYPDEIMAAIGRAVTAIGGVEGKVVRLKVRGVSKGVATELDTKRIRAWRASAVHFHLVLERPELTVGQQYGAPVPEGIVDEGPSYDEAAELMEWGLLAAAGRAWRAEDDWPSLAPTALAGWLSSNPDPYGLDAPERAGVYRLLHEATP